MDINTLLDSIEQIFCWDMADDSIVEAVQAQVGRLNSDELGAFCLD
jgi:hypothetical protein